MTRLLYSLAVLACPVGMGAMMWMMMRGRGEQPPPRDDELARLRTEIETLKAQQPESAAPRS
jgi:hypothetical protein